jgi:hypothetical protein
MKIDFITIEIDVQRRAILVNYNKKVEIMKHAWNSVSLYLTLLSAKSISKWSNNENLFTSMLKSTCMSLHSLRLGLPLIATLGFEMNGWSGAYVCGGEMKSPTNSGDLWSIPTSLSIHQSVNTCLSKNKLRRL